MDFDFNLNVAVPGSISFSETYVFPDQPRPPSEIVENPVLTGDGAAVMVRLTGSV